MLQLQNPWLSHFFTLWPPHLEQSPPRHQALCYSLFLQKQTQDIFLRIFQLSNITPISLCVCACMRVCIFCIVTLETLSTLCVSFFFFSYMYMLYIFIADNISILMYIMCVILCLFSALSRRVGALQISIILFIYMYIY